MKPGDFQLKICELLTRKNTHLWIFYSPVYQEKKLKVDYEKQGFRIIRGEFLISFK